MTEAKQMQKMYWEAEIENLQGMMQDLYTMRDVLDQSVYTEMQMFYDGIMINAQQNIKILNQ